MKITLGDKVKNLEQFKMISGNKVKVDAVFFKRQLQSTLESETPIGEWIDMTRSVDMVGFWNWSASLSEYLDSTDSRKISKSCLQGCASEERRNGWPNEHGKLLGHYSAGLWTDQGQSRLPLPGARQGGREWLHEKSSIFFIEKKNFYMQ